MTAAGSSSVAAVRGTDGSRGTGGSGVTACTSGGRVCALAFLAVGTLVVGMLNRKSRGKVAYIDLSARRGFTSIKLSSS
jgi:hypothetical protein